jgi:SRSO17 transposase
VKTFSHHFRSYRHDVTDKAHQYASGLMQAGARKNMDRMAEVVPDSNSRNLQQFLTHSKWDARSVIDQVAQEANELLGDPQHTGLLIDESGFAKQGKNSVGVSRQWLGRLGKVDNGQVAVFGVLAKNHYAVPVDVKLYLPQTWTNDQERCENAGIPEDERSFHTKDELAIEIVDNARKTGLQFGWVGADAGYGKGPGFCLELHKREQIFVVDVHSDFSIYMEEPKPCPSQRNTGDQQRKHWKTDADRFEVKMFANALDFDNQPIIRLRDTTRGQLTVKSVRFPVWVWDSTTGQGHRFSLLITQTVGGTSQIKVSLCNVPESMDQKNLAWMQLQRYWVERAFEDAKSECGMADYQVRKWSAWHHHMALVMMAMLFMLDERMRHQDTYPLLSCSDIEDLLSRFLPRRDVSQKEVIRQIEYRHRQRKSAIESHARKKVLIVERLEDPD